MSKWYVVFDEDYCPLEHEGYCHISWNPYYKCMESCEGILWDRPKFCPLKRKFTEDEGSLQAVRDTDIKKEGDGGIMEYKVDYTRETTTTTKSGYSIASKAVKDLENEILKEMLIENKDNLIGDPDFGMPLSAYKDDYNKLLMGYYKALNVIPVDWVKKYIEDHTQYMVNPEYEGCEFTEEPIDYYIKLYPHQINTMLKAWEKENENSK